VKPGTQAAAQPWPIMKHDIISEVKMKKIKKETATFTCLFSMQVKKWACALQILA